MSGPKVVRVVTREELQARARAELARVDRALARWSAEVEASGLQTGEARAGATARRAALAAMDEAERFDALTVAVRRELAFLADDAERWRERAAQQRGQALARQLGRRHNARTLLQALKDQGVPVDAGLLQTLESVAGAATDAVQAEAALAMGFRLLAQPAPQDTASSAQLAQARRLTEAGHDESLQQWKRRTAAEGVDARLESLARQLELLRVLEQGAPLAQAAPRLQQGLEQILAESRSDRRSMQLDSLQIELAQAIQAARSHAALQAQGQDLVAELASLEGQDAHAVRAALDAALQAPDRAQLELCMARGREALHAAAQAAAARSRRLAVLQGLATLGYAVQEDMETAWVEQGSIVVQKPTLHGYGVELTGAPAAERLQVRTVAFAHGHDTRDTRRDLDAEQLWCSDFTRLQGHLANAGTQVIVDKAMGVGVVPLKQVEGAAPQQQRRTQAAPLRRMD